MNDWFLNALLILAGAACVVVVPMVLFRYTAAAWAVLWRKEIVMRRRRAA